RDVATEAVTLVPDVQRAAVANDHLPHPPAGREAHGGAFGHHRRPHGVDPHLLGPPAPELLPAFGLHRIGDDLHAAPFRRAGELFLGGVALAERHGDELAD